MRKFNFYPGPATIPLEVLERFSEEIFEYGDSGASFLELSHHCPEILDCHDRVVAAVRDLLQIEDDYYILLLPGGAMGQYSGAVMNLAPNAVTSVAVTGHWSALVSDEVAKYSKVVKCVDTMPDCTTIPPTSSWNVPDDARVLFYVDNETIQGVEFPDKPDVGGVPLILDQSSNIFSRPLDMTGVGAVFACLQKNIGPSGLGLVVARKDLCDAPSPQVPRVWDYQRQAACRSMVNTMPTFQLRMLEFLLDWTKNQGGLAKLDEVNRTKALSLYDCIDTSGFYTNKVDVACRSRMNVPFRLADDSLDDKFVSEALDAGILGIRGHFTVGGMRASIYNAMPVAGVNCLIEFMREFERTNG